MGQIYLFLTGPGAILAASVFAGGMVVRLVLYFTGLDWRLDRLAYKPGFVAGLKGGLHSIFKWLIPFGTRGWRQRPFFAFCFFAFHSGFLILPFFLAKHNEILQYRLGVSFASLPPAVADGLTTLALCAALCLLLRRRFLPEVRLLTRARDYGFILSGAAPLFTGLAARIFSEGHDGWIVAHIASVEALLILAPFTRFSHIVLYFASRWQIGADYSIKRGGHQRGPYFPW